MVAIQGAFVTTIVVSLLSVCALLATCGCATITRGTTEALRIETEPAGAKAQLSTGQTCITPCSMELKRKRDLSVDLQQDGYQPATVSVESKVAGAGAAGMAGNILVGGIIGAGVDAATGATKSLRPNPVHVHLIASDPASVEQFCAASNSVSGAICRGQLKAGAGKEDVKSLLGEPIEKKRDDHEWTYGHDTLEFDDEGRFVSTFVRQ